MLQALHRVYHPSLRVGQLRTYVPSADWGGPWPRPVGCTHQASQYQEIHQSADVKERKHTYVHGTYSTYVSMYVRTYSQGFTASKLEETVGFGTDL